MSRRVLFALLFIAIATCGIHMLLAATAPPPVLPKSHLKADDVTIDASEVPMELHCTGNVKLTSSLYSMVMKCNSLDATAKSIEKIIEATATGDVKVDLKFYSKEPNSKEKDNPEKLAGVPNRKGHATTQKAVFNMEQGRLDLLTVDGVHPKLEINDLTTDEKLMDVTGETITIKFAQDEKKNTTITKIEVKSPNISNGEDE